MPQKSKKSSFGKVILAVLALLIVLGIGAGVIGFNYYKKSLKAVNPTNKEIAFTVEEGSTMNDIIRALYNKNLIKDEAIAKIYVKLNKVNEYYAGNFLLNTSMSADEIFRILSDVNKATKEEVSVTIAEGYWAKDAAKAIAAATNLTEEEILRKWNDIAYVDSLIQKYDVLTEDIFNSERCYLEGYIYPETYNFFAQTTIEQVTEKILDQTEAVYKKFTSEIEASEYTTHEVFTLASVVLFEASSQEDMKMVSGVFDNRMKDGWRLQSSVTVCYAMYNYDSWEDCEENTNIDSKYNTYLNDGLPIGPVCNPNSIAIDAVLNPTENDYYYFIADVETGTVIYARTYQEHLDNVYKYLY